MKVSHKGRRVKGAKFERRVVSELQARGVGAEKVPLSGAVKGSKFDHDISVPVRGTDRKLECKIKANGDGFKKLYGWLAGNYAVCVCMDRSDALVVLRLTDLPNSRHCLLRPSQTFYSPVLSACPHVCTNGRTQTYRGRGMGSVHQLDDLPLLAWRAKGPYLTDADQIGLSRQRLLVFNCLKDGRERTLEQIEDETGEPQASISARWRELGAMKRWFMAKRRAAPGSRLRLYRMDITKPFSHEAWKK